MFLDTQGRVLLHHRKDNGTWGIPGGAMEIGECFEETAAREALEEVGLTCHTLQFFCVYSGPELYYRYPNGDEVYNVGVTYLCRDFSGDICVDPTEGTEAAFFAIDALPSNISLPIKPVLDDLVRRHRELL